MYKKDKITTQKVEAKEEKLLLENSLAVKKILIVDDNRDAADSLAKLLVALGTEACAVYGAEEALAKLDEFTPDIFLLDISMPHMDGYDLIGMLRKKGIRVPAIALTGHGLRDDLQKAAHAGFVTHLTKPVGVKELCSIIGCY